ncbi:hypothetical protein PIB30_016525 [Stylosanthes scabra]|uniref:Uncharacterized protein n=1 Tax=Stylosanthes scabra TaxID=79078 RepID=A0ABU6Q7C0_9FABA|nr:hypothetical protein [Stylosanthes scabra]
MSHQNDGLLNHWNPSHPLRESVGEEQKEAAKPTVTQHRSTATSPVGAGRRSNVSFVQRPPRRTAASTVRARTSPRRLPPTSSDLAVSIPRNIAGFVPSLLGGDHKRRIPIWVFSAQQSMHGGICLHLRNSHMWMNPRRTRKSLRKQWLLMTVRRKKSIASTNVCSGEYYQVTSQPELDNNGYTLNNNAAIGLAFNVTENLPKDSLLLFGLEHYCSMGFPIMEPK